MPLAALCGCHLFSSGAIEETCDEIADCETLSDTDNSAEFAIDALTPAYGLSSGGYSVKIQGSGLNRTDTVTIGGEIAEISSLSADSVVVNAPAGLPGTQTVTLRSVDGAKYSVLDGFQYFQDAEEAVQLMVHLWVSRGMFFTEDLAATFGIAGWVDDVDWRWWEGYGASREDFEDPAFQGGCVGSAPDMPSAIAGSYDDITLSNDGVPRITLSVGSDGLYAADAIDPDDFPEGISLDLEPHLLEEGITISKTDFAYAPADVEDRNLVDGAGSGVIAANTEIQLLNPTCDPDCDPEVKVIVVGEVLPGPGGEAATIHCVAKDDGYFRLDQDAWAFDNEWPEGEPMVLSLGRIYTVDTVLPHTNGIASVSIINWTIVHGTAGALSR